MTSNKSKVDDVVVGMASSMSKHDDDDDNNDEHDNDNNDKLKEWYTKYYTTLKKLNQEVLEQYIPSFNNETATSSNNSNDDDEHQLISDLRDNHDQIRILLDVWNDMPEDGSSEPKEVSLYELLQLTGETFLYNHIICHESSSSSDDDDEAVVTNTGHGQQTDLDIAICLLQNAMYIGRAIFSSSTNNEDNNNTNTQTPSSIISSTSNNKLSMFKTIAELGIAYDENDMTSQAIEHLQLAHTIGEEVFKTYMQSQQEKETASAATAAARDDELDTKQSAETMSVEEKEVEDKNKAVSGNTEDRKEEDEVISGMTEDKKQKDDDDTAVIADETNIKKQSDAAVSKTKHEFLIRMIVVCTTLGELFKEIGNIDSAINLFQETSNYFDYEQLQIEDFEEMLRLSDEVGRMALEKEQGIIIDDSVIEHVKQGIMLRENHIGGYNHPNIIESLIILRDIYIHNNDETNASALTERIHTITSSRETNGPSSPADGTTDNAAEQ